MIFLEIFINSFCGVLSIFLIVGCGFFIDRMRWVNESCVTFLSILVNKVCLPPLLFLTTYSKIDAKAVHDMGESFWVPFASIVLGMMAGWVLSKLVGAKRNHVGIITSTTAISNTIFAGLPICVSIFGERALPHVMTYYFANSLLFWTIGVQLLAMGNTEKEVRIFSWQTLKSIASPPLTSGIFGFCLLLAGVQLPQVLLKSMGYVAGMTTPLAMIFIGIAVSRTDYSAFHFNWEFFGGVFGRFVVGPLLLLVLLVYFGTDPFMGEVFMVMAAMPAMANIAIISSNYGGDYKFAATVVTATTCLSALVIPLYIMLLYYLLGWTI